MSINSIANNFYWGLRHAAAAIRSGYGADVEEILRRQNRWGETLENLRTVASSLPYFEGTQKEKEEAADEDR